jgi:hypothetical protein
MTDDTLKQQPNSELVAQDWKTTQITRVPPKEDPVLIEQWVVWELKSCIYTNGNKLSTGDLHNILKLGIEKQKVPIEILFSEKASWVVQGARGTIKLDNDRRPRVVAKLKDSPYTDIQFITGIDYFGGSNGSDWADLQMMLIVQPEEINIPPKPIKPSPANINPIIPNEALIVLGIIALFLFTLGSIGQLFGFIGIMGAIIIYIKSNKNVKDAQNRYTKEMNKYEQDLEEYERQKEEIALQREEREKNRLSRSFKTDDLRMFHAVMIELVVRAVKENFIDKGAKVKESVENNGSTANIESKKNIFDNF